MDKTNYELVYDPSQENIPVAVAVKIPSTCIDSTAESPLLVAEYQEVTCQRCHSIYNLPIGAFTYRCKSCNHFNNMNPNQNLNSIFKYCVIL